MTPRELMRVGPVIPVIVIEELANAVPLAKALVAGGVRVLEVTLRTPVALDAIRAMKQFGSGAIVNVSSVAATLSSPGEAAYDASNIRNTTNTLDDILQINVGHGLWLTLVAGVAIVVGGAIGLARR